MSKCKMHGFGMQEDCENRLGLARVDDVAYRSQIKSARDAIYKENHVVNSTFVEKCLGPDSLTPISVCQLQY